jgi:hypothetical protein
MKIQATTNPTAAEINDSSISTEKISSYWVQYSKGIPGKSDKENAVSQEIKHLTTFSCSQQICTCHPTMQLAVIANSSCLL